MEYFTIENEFGVSIIAFEGDVCIGIPEDEANTDYQAYLAWVAEGNTPKPWTPK